MEQHDREELAEVNAARKGFYEFLASMYKLELTDEQIGTLTKQDLPTDAEYVGAGYATVKEYLRHRDSGTRQELAVDYARVFLCAGMYEQLMAPPYESVYTSEEHLLMQVLPGRGAGPAGRQHHAGGSSVVRVPVHGEADRARGRGARCWRRGALRRAVREATRVLRRAPGQLGAAFVR